MSPQNNNREDISPLNNPSPREYDQDIEEENFVYRKRARSARLPNSLADRRRIIYSVNKILTSAGEDPFGKEDIVEIKKQGRKEVKKEVPFPTFIASLALIKDIIDTPSVVADLASVTGVGLVFTGFYRVLTTSLSVAVAVIIFFWLFGKTSIVRRLLWKKFVWRFVAAFLAELLFPVIPTMLVIVILAHYRETKIVRLNWLILEAIDKIEKEIAKRE